MHTRAAVSVVDHSMSAVTPLNSSANDRRIFVAIGHLAPLGAYHEVSTVPGEAHIGFMWLTR
jgi:hypothetical protein